MTEKKIVALVPAYNEETRISSVLEVITSSPLIRETIVIDDGSYDNTSQEAAMFPVRILRWSENKGKGAALQRGIDEAHDADIFLFLDADLLYFNTEHIERLLAPLSGENSSAMTIGVFRHGKNTRINLAQRYFSILNGQRALRRDFINILPDLSWSRFGVEILLTRYAMIAGESVSYPELEGLSHVMKEEKLGFWNGVKYRLQMYNECLFALFNYKKMIRRNPGKVPPHILKRIG